MALSFDSIQKAYKVFHELKVKNVPSWPEDLQEWTEEERKHPKEDTVYGFAKKSDDGWENLFFFKRNPTTEFKAKFDELKKRVPNSSFANLDTKSGDLWIFGWF